MQEPRRVVWFVLWLVVLFGVGGFAAWPWFFVCWLGAWEGRVGGLCGEALCQEVCGGLGAFA